MVKISKNCEGCGKTISTYKQRKYCGDCKKLRAKEAMKRFKEKKKNAVHIDIAPPVERGLSVDPYCKDLPKSAVIPGQSLELSRDVHNADVSGISYGKYMGMKYHILNRRMRHEN